jgi:hypothetical protein
VGTWADVISGDAIISGCVGAAGLDKEGVGSSEVGTTGDGLGSPAQAANTIKDISPSASNFIVFITKS